ncbi:MAG: hypothetical protein ACRD17_04845, partial [Terriglobales bacterium]
SMTAKVASHISTARGEVHALRAGQHVEGENAERRIVAAIGGRVELKIGEETAVLRASDVAVIPARVRYRLRALEDATIYQSPHPETGDDNLWGV